jgi:hypothetical protein
MPCSTKCRNVASSTSLYLPNRSCRLRTAPARKERTASATSGEQLDMTPRAAPAENSDTDDAARFTLDVSVNTDEDTDDAAARSTPDANRTEAAMRSFVQLKSAASSVILPSIWGRGGGAKASEVSAKKA